MTGLTRAVERLAQRAQYLHRHPSDPHRLVRIHPAFIAQAAANTAVLTDGRFRLGVGTGEA